MPGDQLHHANLSQNRIAHISIKRFFIKDIFHYNTKGDKFCRSDLYNNLSKIYEIPKKYKYRTYEEYDR